MNISRRQIVQSASAAGFLAALGQNAFAQAQLDTAKIVNGFAACGTSDTICRRLAQSRA